MTNVIRYFKSDTGSVKRIVENRERKKFNTGTGRFDYEYRTVERNIFIEEYNGQEWVKDEDLGEYVKYLGACPRGTRPVPPVDPDDMPPK